MLEIYEKKLKSSQTYPGISKIASTTLAAHVRQGKYEIEVVSTRKPCEVRPIKLN